MTIVPDDPLQAAHVAGEKVRKDRLQREERQLKAAEIRKKRSERAAAVLTATTLSPDPILPASHRIKPV